MRNATKYGNMTQDHVMHLLLVSERGQAGLASQPTPTGPRLRARTGTRLTGATRGRSSLALGGKASVALSVLQSPASTARIPVSEPRNYGLKPGSDSLRMPAFPSRGFSARLPSARCRARLQAPPVRQSDPSSPSQGDPRPAREG